MAQRASGALQNAVAPGVRIAHIEPIQTRIARNRRKFLRFMIVFTTAVSAGIAATVGFGVALVTLAFGMRTVLGLWATPPDAGTLLGFTVVVTFVASLAVTWTWALVRLGEAEYRIVERLGARVVKGGALMQTKSMLRDMTIAAGLPHTPQLYVIDIGTVNAFVVGRSYERARIGVTRGLLERIPPEEQRAVFANLVSRILSLDTLWATAVSAIMGPLWAMREFDLKYDMKVWWEEPPTDSPDGAEGAFRLSDARAGCLPIYGAGVLISETLSWYHYESAWRANEKADAEGMMLLKDPASMIRAIEHVLERNNSVPSAGDAYSQLFYCWAGFGFAPEDDPEMRRVARLREVLGAEGAPFIPRPNVPGWPPPVPPRVEMFEKDEVDEPGLAE